ncbi:MAG: hypothetical protein ACYCTY_06935 [Sulfuricella sp.]
MSFLSATKMGKELCLSYQKVNEVLASKGLYNKATKQPTEFAIENGLAEIRTTQSKFHGKIVEFNTWDFDKIKMYFPVPKEAEKASPCKNPEEAFDKICAAFGDFGEILKIEVNVPKKGLTTEATEAVVQSYFSDPDFLRGTLLLHRHFHREEAETVKKITLALANELFNEARKKNAKRAKSNLTVIEAALSWLCMKAD